MWLFGCRRDGLVVVKLCGRGVVLSWLWDFADVVFTKNDEDVLERPCWLSVSRWVIFSGWFLIDVPVGVMIK